MLRSILLLAALFIAAPSNTQAVQPAAKTAPAVLKITWVSDVGGNRILDVVWETEPTIGDVAKITARLEALSIAEGYELNGKSDVAKGENKTDRRITLGYKKTPTTGVLTKLSFSTQVGGTVIYAAEYAGKHDEKSLTAFVEGLARESAKLPISDKVTVKTTAELGEKKGSVTVVFKGGAFDLLK